MTTVEDSLIADVDASTFQTLVLEGRGPIVVEFMSYGCGHCRVLEPVLAGVARTLKAKERFYRVNVAADAELANSYGISGTPTLVSFRDGREVGRSEGPPPATAAILRAVTRSFL